MVVLVLVGNAAGPHLQQQNCKAVDVASLGHLVELQHFRSQVWQGTCIEARVEAKYQKMSEAFPSPKPHLLAYMSDVRLQVRVSETRCCCVLSCHAQVLLKEIAGLFLEKMINATLEGGWQVCNANKSEHRIDPVPAMPDSELAVRVPADNRKGDSLRLTECLSRDVSVICAQHPSHSKVSDLRTKATSQHPPEIRVQHHGQISDPKLQFLCRVCPGGKGAAIICSIPECAHRG